MALINDPDDIRRSSQAATGTPDGELYIDAAAKTLELISTDDWGSSNLDPADGVTLQALYSKLKLLWKSEADLIVHEFPMVPITNEQFEFVEGWVLKDTTTATRSYIRYGGWAEKDATNATTREYMNVITLGSFVEEATQYAYYFWAGDTSKTDFTYPGPVNEAVQIYGDASNGNFDNRNTVLTIAIRPTPTGSSGSVVGYTFDTSTTTEIGAPTVTYQAYRFPLSSAVDLKLTLTDAEISSLISNKTFSLEWYAAQQNSSTFLSPDLNGGPFLFSIVIDNAAGTATPAEVYNVTQYWLRQDTDIDAGAGTQYGVLTPDLMVFVGDVLETYDIDPSGTAGGVLIGSIDTNFAAFFKMRDDGGVLRVFPSIASGKIVFNPNLIEDAATAYWLFFDDAGGNVYPGSNAIIVDDYGGTDIAGDLHHVVTTPASGSATGSSNGSASAAGSVMTVAAAGWTLDDFIDKVLVITTGDNAGHYWITDNDATTVTVTPAFEATDASMSWEIRDKNTAGEIVWDFDYTNNVQGGRTADADAPVSVVALGLRTGQYVVAPGNTIINGSGQQFSVTAALERNFADPT